MVLYKIGQHGSFRVSAGGDMSYVHVCSESALLVFPQNRKDILSNVGKSASVVVSSTQRQALAIRIQLQLESSREPSHGSSLAVVEGAEGVLDGA